MVTAQTNKTEGGGGGGEGEGRRKRSNIIETKIFFKSINKIS